MISIEQAKEELKEYRENVKYIQQKNEDIEELKNILVHTTSKLSQTKVSIVGVKTDKFSDGLYKIEKLEKEKDEELAELLSKKFIVDAKIDKLKFPFRDVLFMRYSRGKSWQEIRDVLEYDSEKYVFKLHGKAIQLYAEL